MDFNFNPEQLQFADALKRWIGRDYGLEARRAIVHSEAGVSSDAWATLVELGMTALPVPEEQGGFSGTAVDMFVVMRELGRGLHVLSMSATPTLSASSSSELLVLSARRWPLKRRP